MQKIATPRKGIVLEFSKKKAFMDKGVLSELEATIHILCEEHGRCTATDVLRFAKMEETSFSRTVVIEYAQYLEYTIETSGRGFVIVDRIY